ncbi:hypothetical protein [Microbacterium sp. NPDC091662]
MKIAIAKALRNLAERMDPRPVAFLTVRSSASVDEFLDAVNGKRD